MRLCQLSANLISLTCIYCKLVEHIIAYSLTKHLNNHNVLYELSMVLVDEGPAKPNKYNW